MIEWFAFRRVLLMPDPVRADALRPTEEDLHALGALYGVARLERVGGFENLIFRSDERGGVVLRLTHTSRRSVADVEAETEFMEHLSHHDVPVVAPIRSRSGALSEELTLSDGNRIVTYCMTEAPGKIVRPIEWTDAHLVAHGDLLGRVHAASASFVPSGSRRPAWTDPVFDPGTSVLGDDEFTLAWQAARQRAASTLGGETELLIHQDAHFWNVHIVGEETLTLFDFDDCAYGSAIHDIAIVLFYWLLTSWEDHEVATRRFLSRVLEGHSRHEQLPTGWPDAIDRIMQVREADIYLLLALDGEEWKPDIAEWMEGRRQRILDGVPLLGRPLADVL